MPQPTEKQIRAGEDLEAAIRDENAEATERALVKAWEAGLHPIHCQSLIVLVEAPWHFRHEDVVHAIQELRSADAVGALERTTISAYPYREYDDYFMLASQCIWALADIGTPEAHDTLTRLANCGTPGIARHARERLNNWQKELPRKAFRSNPT